MHFMDSFVLGAPILELQHLCSPCVLWIQIKSRAWG